MSVGRLILVFTSIVDTVLLALWVTNAVARHRVRAATADTPPGTTSTPATPSTTTTRTGRDRCIAPRFAVLVSTR